MNEQVFGGEHHSGRPARAAVDGDGARLSRPLPELRQGQAVRVLPEDRRQQCEHCGEEIHHHRADDLPAYLVVVIVGHVVVGGFMGVEATSDAVDSGSIWRSGCR